MNRPATMAQADPNDLDLGSLSRAICARIRPRGARSGRSETGSRIGVGLPVHRSWALRIPRVYRTDLSSPLTAALGLPGERREGQWRIRPHMVAELLCIPAGEIRIAIRFPRPSVPCRTVRPLGKPPVNFPGVPLSMPAAALRWERSAPRHGELRRRLRARGTRESPSPCTGDRKQPPFPASIVLDQPSSLPRALPEPEAFNTIAARCS
jgi:hypothetical protein